MIIPQDATYHADSLGMARRTLQSIANRIEVTSFVDYREFLADLYRQAKEVTTPYSYEAFASDLGFSAINTLRLVILKKRSLSDKSAQTIVKALDLRRENRKYFLAMVKHVNARTTKQKNLYFHKMLESKQQSIVSHRDKDQLEFLSEWYHWVVLEMLRLDDGVADPARLSERMYGHVGVEKVRRSLALLESLNLVAPQGEHGQLRPVKDSPTLVPSDAAAGHLAMARHHQSMLSVAQSALVEVPAEQREFNALTINVSKESFAKLKNHIQAFCEDVLAEENRPQKRECVAQLNINLFTLTKWEEE